MRKRFSKAPTQGGGRPSAVQARQEGMKRFDTDQLLLALLVAAAISGLIVYRLWVGF